MTSVAVVNQHTNNYGDDAAGIALIDAATSFLGATSVDVFYIWDRGLGGLPIESDVVTHRHLPTLSGSSDRRAQLAVAVAARFLFGRRFRGDIASLVETCKKADVVYVSPAGSNIGIYKDWMYLFALVALVVEGVRPIFCQNTLAASNSRLFNRLALYVLRRSELFVRERASQEWLQTQGLSSYLGVDTALLLPNDDQGAFGGEPYIAVVPTRLANWHRDHREFDDGDFLERELVAALANAALARNLGVTLVPHLYGPENEATVLDAMRAKLVQAGVLATVAEVSSVDEYIKVIQNAEAALSMRYHGLILAAKAGVPVVALSYENKMREAAAYLDSSEHLLDVRRVDGETIERHLLDSIDSRAASKSASSSRVGDLQAIAAGPILAAQSRILRG